MHQPVDGDYTQEWDDFVSIIAISAQMKMNVRMRNTTVTRMLSVTTLLAHITVLASMGTQEMV